MITIGYVISQLENSGPVNILYGIIKNLDEKIFKSYIITLSEEKVNSRKKEFENLGVEVVLHKVNNFNLLLKEDKKFKEILINKKIDILHSHCFRSAILTSKINILKISTLHLDFQTDFIYKYGVLKGKIFEKIYLSALKKMNLNISCGKGVANLIFAHNKLVTEVIQNGIDREKININNVKESKEELRKKLRLKENEKYFISVGSLDERKNVLWLSENFINSRIKKLNLILIGEGNKRQDIENLKNKNIILPGKCSLLEVQEYLKASDYYVATSKSEGLPNSVLEALEFELPVLLSDIEPHKEILENYDCGNIFKLNDKDDFKEKLKNILNIEKKEKDFKKIKKFIDAKRMSKNYEEIYKKIKEKNGCKYL